MDTFCDSRIRTSSREAGGAAAITEKDKLRKHAHRTGPTYSIRLQQKPADQ